MYTISGEDLLRLASMAAASPTADVDAIFSILQSAERELEDSANAADTAEEPAGTKTVAKPLKPE